jgi:hypothetical protein
VYLVSTSRPKGPYVPPTGNDLNWLVPAEASFPDGRPLDGELVAAMIAEWGRIRGGAVYVERFQRRWAHVSDDPYTIGGPRLEGEGNDVTAVLNHALGRAVTAGLRSPHSEGNVPGSSYLSAITLLDDAAAVLLAVLDRHLVGAGDLAAWYLASPCDARNCLYHGDGRGPEHPGAGVTALDYLALSPLYWYPGLGSVEVHTAEWARLASQPADSRRPIRLPTPATVPPGIFRHPRQA